jgi:hypothetical protein
MAKVKGTESKFLVSTDNITYYALPIDSSSPSFTADELDATTLQDAQFMSMVKGLKSGSLSGSVKLKSGTECKAYVGYKAVLKISGTAIATTAEAMTLVSGLVYKITDATKNCWSRNVAVTVYDGAVEVDAADIKRIDYLFGIVEFVSGYTVTGAITVDCSYLPLTVVAGRTGYSLTQTANVPESSDLVTVQANNGWKEYFSGRKTVSLTLDGNYDTTSGFFDLLVGDTVYVVEGTPGGGGASFRGYFNIIGYDSTSDGDNTVTDTINLSLSSGCSTGQSFSWNIVALGDTTVYDRGVYECIKAWLEGTPLYFKAMVDDANNIGYTGQVVLSDASLSGSIGDVETMSVSMTTSGEVTEVA